MKKLILPILAVALLAIGCTTVKTVTTGSDGSTVTNTVKVFDLQLATNSINNIVPGAVKVLVAKEPKAGVYLLDVAGSINVFILKGNLSPDNLKKVLASTGLKELKTDEALAITETILALYQTYFGQAVQDGVSQNVNVLPILRALSDSIMQGLAAASSEIRQRSEGGILTTGAVIRPDGLYMIGFVGRNPKPCPYGGWIVEN